MKNPYTEVTHIINRLYIDVTCPNPECHENLATSLGIIYRKSWIQCSRCGKKFHYEIPGDNLAKVVIEYNRLREQLHKLGHTVMFFQKPFGTIWSQEDKEQNST